MKRAASTALAVFLFSTCMKIFAAPANYPTVTKALQSGDIQDVQEMADLLNDEARKGKVEPGQLWDDAQNFITAAQKAGTTKVSYRLKGDYNYLPENMSHQSDPNSVNRFIDGLVLHTHYVPSPEKPLLEHARDTGKEFETDNLICYDDNPFSNCKKLDSNEFGAFVYKSFWNGAHWVRDWSDRGYVDWNSEMRICADYIGTPCVAFMAFHEFWHAGDKTIDPEHPYNTEIPGFRMQYWLIKEWDPTGQKLYGIRKWLRFNQKDIPAPVYSVLFNITEHFADIREHAEGSLAQVDGQDQYIGHFWDLVHDNGYQENPNLPPGPPAANDPIAHDPANMPQQGLPRGT